VTKAGSLLLTGLLIAVLAVLPAGAGPGPKGDDSHGPKGVVHPAGQVYCTSTPLISGGVLLPGGCYMLSVMRSPRGTFLAFVPPSVHVPPGQLVRLDTPAGPKRMGRLFLVPISTTAALVPMNTMTLVTTQIVPIGPQININLMGLPVTVPAVVFMPHP